MIPSEQWLPVVGYEGLYSVSSHGRVRSHLRSGRILRPGTSTNGYKNVGLCLNGVVSRKKVHHLVMEAFVGPRGADQDTRHLDGDPSNNSLANLAYGSRSENMQDKLAHGTNHQVNKTHCPQGHPYDESNTYIYPSNGRRGCRTCAARQVREYQARKRAKLAA